MAKDGTLRGGARAGAGKKAKALADKVSEGRAASIISLPGPADLPKPADLHGNDMPPVKEFMKAKQAEGEDLCAEEIFNETWAWLQQKGCDRLISVLTVQEYAMCAARWIQCEEFISKYGLLSKHPTTGSPIATPYAQLGSAYMKQASQIWYGIFQVVKENCLAAYEGATPQDDVMERLLRTRKGG